MALSGWVVQAVAAQVRLFWPELNGRTGGGATLRSLWPVRAMLSGPRSHARTAVVRTENERTFDRSNLQYVRSILQYVRLTRSIAHIDCGHERPHRTPRLRVYDRSRSRRARDSGIGEGFDGSRFVPPRGVRAIDRSKGDRLHGTEEHSEGEGVRSARRSTGDRCRSHRTERSAGNGRERARHQWEDRSWLPALDLHSPDRSEGYDLGSHPGAGERDARSLHRPPFVRRPFDRGFGRLAVDPQRGAIVHAVAPLTDRRITFHVQDTRVDRSLAKAHAADRADRSSRPAAVASVRYAGNALSVRETGNVLSSVTTPPCRPPKEESRQASRFVRALAGGAYFSSHDWSRVCSI